MQTRRLLAGRASYHRSLVVMIATIGFALFMVLFYVQSVSAAQTVPYKVNFQGRLTNSSGMAMPDGSYNMKYRLFTTESGGVPVWESTRETTNRVQVTNGQFSAQLGDAAALTPSVFTNYPLYFEVELPTTATVTCSTASCAVFDGTEIMTPRRPLGASPYAMNADTLDGVDSASFARKDMANTFSAATTFSGSVTVNAASSFNGNVEITGSSTLKVGSSVTVADAGNTGSVVLGTNGISLTGAARKAQVVTLAAEYPGATFTADGTNNDGDLSSEFCSSSARLNINPSACPASSDEFNYYQWTSPQSASQDYDIYVRYRIPADYSAGSLSNLKMVGWGTTTSGESVRLDMFSGSLTPCGTIANAVTSNAAWTSGTLASPLGSCTIAAGDMVTFRVRVAAGLGNIVRAGPISFEYLGRF